MIDEKPDQVWKLQAVKNSPKTSVCTLRRRAE